MTGDSQPYQPVLLPEAVVVMEEQARAKRADGGGGVGCRDVFPPSLPALSARRRTANLRWSLVGEALQQPYVALWKTS